MNKHDITRFKRVAKTLERAKQQMDEALLYLDVSKNPVEYADAYGISEHIDIAFEKLSERVKDT